MKVKRYFASNMRTALDMVKLEQGPDVLILSNRKVDGGVELITADELTEQEAARLAERNEARVRSDVAAPTIVAATPAASSPQERRPFLPPDNDSQEFLWTDSGTMAQMHEELRSLKGLLEAQLSGLAWSDFGTRHPLRARLVRVLSRVGISPSLARDLADNVPDGLEYRDGWHRVLALLVLRMNVLHDPILRQGGRIALLGATGVGKSTMASKLAARYALAHGAESVAIVSMDDRRLGAHEQMKAFGRLLGCTVYTVRTCEELALLLETQEERGLVLIDTPGNAPDDVRFRELASGLNALQAQVQMHHVIAATTDYLATAKMLTVTANLAVDACILTKIDEAATLGPSLSALIESGLPLAYTSAGQRVPDDLDVVEPRKLVELALNLAKAVPQTTDPVILERVFSA